MKGLIVLVSSKIPLTEAKAYIKRCLSQKEPSPEAFGKLISRVGYLLFKYQQIIPFFSFIFKSYETRAEIFAKNAKSIFANKSLDLVINSDNITLLAGKYVSEITGAKQMYDAIELPRLDTRAGEAFDGMSVSMLKRIHAQEEKIINNCSAITVIGPSFKTWFAQNHPDVKNVTVVRNCRNYVEPNVNATIKQSIGLKDSDLLLLFINGIYKGQGIEVVLQALKTLPDHIHFAALGPVSIASYTDELQSLAREIGVEKRFHLLPSKPWQEMLAYASGADIGIIPRQSDRLNNYLSMPNRIFELVMARLPVATANLPDIAALVTEYDIGMVFNEKDPESISKTILAMSDGPNLKKYKDNIAQAARHIKWENEKKSFVEAVEGMFEEKTTLNVAILSRKDISKNNRIARLSRSLTEAGHRVTIGAPTGPGEIHADPKAKYVIIPDKMLLHNIRKTTLMRKKIISLCRKILHLSWRFPRIIIITGAPRSGTHLVNSVLTSSPKIGPLLTESWPLVNLLTAIRHSAIHTVRYPGHYFRSRDEAISLYIPVFKKLLMTFHKNNDKYPIIVFRVPAIAKSINFLCMLLQKTGMNYKIIVMIRDPRDVIASIRKINSKLERGHEEKIDGTVEELCEKFLLDYYNPLLEINNDKMMFVRYEDLTGDTIRCVKNLEKFLNLDLSEYSQLSEWKRVKDNWVIDSNTKQSAWVTDLYKKPVSQSSVGNYTKYLTSDEIRHIEEKMSPFFDRFSYKKNKKLKTGAIA